MARYDYEFRIPLEPTKDKNAPDQLPEGSRQFRYIKTVSKTLRAVQNHCIIIRRYYMLLFEFDLGIIGCELQHLAGVPPEYVE